MPDPNVPSFFLIILCGFGAVWGYRKITKPSKVIGEFEYVAFSSLWGSIIFMPIAYVLDKAGILAPLSAIPFIATPFLFVTGFFLGQISAIIANRLKSQKTK